MMKPLFRNVLIKPDPEEEKTKSGIIIPEKAKEKPYFGEVIAVGQEVKFVKVGDRVMYKKWGGNEFDIEKVPHIMVEEIDLLSIL